MFGPPIIIPGRTLRAAELPVQKDLSAIEQSLLPPNRVCCFHHSCRNRRHTTMTTTTTTTTTSATNPDFLFFPKSDPQMLVPYFTTVAKLRLHTTASVLQDFADVER